MFIDNYNSNYISPKLAKGIASATKSENAKRSAGIRRGAIREFNSEMTTRPSLKNVSGAENSSTSVSTPKRIAGSFKKGGKVKKKGIYLLHKGERVLNTKQTKNFETEKNTMQGSSGKKAKRTASGRGPLANKKQKYFLG